MINRRSIQVSPSLNIFIKPEDNIDNKQKNILNLKDKLVNEFDQDKYNLEECFSSDDKMNIGILFDKISQLINILSSNKEHNFCISNVQYYKNILEEAKENALFIEKIFNPPPYEKDKKRLSVPPIISIYNDDGKFIAANDIYLKLNKLESIIRAKEIDAKGEGELMKYIYPKSYEKVLKQIPLIIDSGGYRYYDLIAERTGRNLRWNSIRNNIYGGSVRIAEDVTKRPFFRFSLGQEKIINKLEIMPLHFHDLIKHFYSLIKMFIRPEEVKIILDKRPDIKVIGLKDVSGQVKNIVSEIINNNSNIQLKSLTLENFIELVKINIEFERIFNKLAY
ncbi:hypothetical protein KAZ01_03355, partial [Candidatus Gracilibacteria bacterium]|nr:hypothetical protein [Candidatus Gracilibacteria bacterium]